jgi:hypothetical protein
MNMHVLDVDNLPPHLPRLRSSATTSSMKARALAVALRKPCGFLRLIGDHGAAAGFHRHVVHRHCLRGEHALDLTGRVECPQAGDRDKELPVAIVE